MSSLIPCVLRHASAAWLLVAVWPVAPAHAQAITGPDVLAEAGVAGGGSLAAAQPGPSTWRAGWFAGATVVSSPVNLGRNWAFGVAAGLAREPVAGMARIDGRVVAAYFDAVRASGLLRFVHTSGPFDVAIIGRYAETHDDRTQPFTPAANDNGLWTFLFEATAHLRVYASRDAAMPAAHRHLMPVFDIYGGVKHDRRFHRAGDLEPYDDPTGRALGGVVVRPWRWRGTDGFPRVAVGAGVDFETAIRTGVRLPSAGRVFARADVDLRRLTAH